MEDFGKKLKAVMEAKGLSYQDVAKIAKTAPGTVSRWVNEHTVPAKVSQKAILEELEKLCAKG